ncbi:hypothetical protein ASD31_11660 [Rhizobium sp. Root482]|nr:hypothetical protein ASD31_11660 [Rhizobium sp. Root482]
MSGEEFLSWGAGAGDTAGFSNSPFAWVVREPFIIQQAFPMAAPLSPSSSGLTRGSAITPFSVLTVWILGSSPRMTKEKVEADEGGG